LVPSSGKNTVAFGFIHFSVSDHIQRNPSLILPAPRNV
jgi:hypothetical protein